jgi:hypothetical protein
MNDETRTTKQERQNYGPVEITGALMKDRIQTLLAQIGVLEDELKDALHQREERVLFHVNGRRIEFERGVRTAHARLRTGLLRWVLTNRPQNFLTGPIIYSLGIPLVFLDVCVSLYQALCFPVYGIARARRADYMAYDRQHLDFLNFFEKFHCRYCAYANGLIAYASEIAARTEQYFCPIKHAHKVLGTHARYARFIEYGDADDYHARLEDYRAALRADPPA